MPSSPAKNAFSILLIPVLVSFLAAFLPTLFVLASDMKMIFPFALGLAAHLALRSGFPGRDSYFYILAHEMSHALLGLFHGIKVKKIRVKKNSGYVVFGGRPDYITELAPYFVPFYALAAAMVYFSAGCFMDVSRYRGLFLFVEGFFVSFHLVNTVEIFSGPIQSDFKKAGGFFFSLMFASTLNLIFLALILKMLFPGLIDLSAVIGKAGANLAGTAKFSARAFKIAKTYLAEK